MSRILSVLCVSEDPLFLERICRNLERNRDVFVETLVSIDDALHLTDYIFFDVVITDCLSWHGEKNGFLKALREQGMETPIICCIGRQDMISRVEIRRYGRVRFLAWEGCDTSAPFDDLARSVREMAEDTGRYARNTVLFPGFTEEKMI